MAWARRARIRIMDAITGSFLQYLIPPSFWPWVWGGIITGATMIGGALYSWPWPVLIIAGVIVMAFCALSINEFSAWRDRRSNVQSLNVAIPGTVEFFSNQDELRIKYPDSWVLKRTHQLYGCLISGHGLMGKNLDANVQIFRQIIVPDPKGQYLSNLISHCVAYPSLRYEYYENEINKTIAAAKRANPQVPVRQFDDFIGMTFLICNPNSDDAWAHVSTALPLLEPDKQQTYRIEKKSNPQAFAAIWENWERMWSQSKPV